ncbi:MAG: hypothetical protein AAF517_20090, partial [Planctomycetota bacterium]
MSIRRDGRTKRRLLAWIVCLGLVVLGCISWGARSSLLERWYLFRLESTDVAVQDRACQALGEMKSSLAVPRLLDLLEERPGNAPFLSAPGAALCEIGGVAADGVIERLERSFVESRMVSARIDEEPLSDAELRSRALESVLQRMGSEAVKPMGEALGRASSRVAELLVSLLERLGPAARPASLSLFRHCLSQNDGDALLDELLRTYPEDIPGMILGSNDLDSHEVVDYISGALAHGSNSLRSARLLSPLERWLWSDQPRLLRLAVVAIRRLSYDGVALNADWQARVADRLAVLWLKEPELRDLILDMSRGNARRVMSLFEVIAGRWGAVRPYQRDAVLLHVRSIVRTEEAVQFDQSQLRQLAELLSHEVPHTRSLAVEILACVDANEEIRSALCDQLNDLNFKARLRAALALLSSDVCSIPAEDVLERWLSASAEVTKRGVLKGLEHVSIRPGSRIPEFVERLVHSGPYKTRRAALSTLVSLLDSESASDFLVKTIRSDDPFWSKSHEFLFDYLQPFLGQPAVAEFLVEQMASGDEVHSWTYRCRKLVKEAHRETVKNCLAAAIRSQEPRWVTVRAGVLRLLTRMHSTAGTGPFLYRVLIDREPGWREVYPRILQLFASLEFSDPRILDAALNCWDDESLRPYALDVLTSIAERDPGSLVEFLAPESGLSVAKRLAVLRILKRRAQFRKTEEFVPALLICLDAEDEIAEFAAKRLVNRVASDACSIDAHLRGARHRSQRVRKVFRDSRWTVTLENEQHISDLLLHESVVVQKLVLRYLSDYQTGQSVLRSLRKLLASPDIFVAA